MEKKDASIDQFDIPDEPYSATRAPFAKGVRDFIIRRKFIFYGITVFLVALVIFGIILLSLSGLGANNSSQLASSPTEIVPGEHVSGKASASPKGGYLGPNYVAVLVGSPAPGIELVDLNSQRVVANYNVCSPTGQVVSDLTQGLLFVPCQSSIQVINLSYPGMSNLVSVPQYKDYSLSFDESSNLLYIAGFPIKQSPLFLPSLFVYDLKSKSLFTLGSITPTEILKVANVETVSDSYCQIDALDSAGFVQVLVDIAINTSGYQEYLVTMRKSGSFVTSSFVGKTNSPSDLLAGANGDSSVVANSRSIYVSSLQTDFNLTKFDISSLNLPTVINRADFAMEPGSTSLFLASNGAIDEISIINGALINMLPDTGMLSSLSVNASGTQLYVGTQDGSLQTLSLQGIQTLTTEIPVAGVNSISQIVSLS